MRTTSPVCLSNPGCGLCTGRRGEGRPEGWIPYASPDAVAGLLGLDPPSAEAEAG
jgi:hypothetical protein